MIKAEHIRNRVIGLKPLYSDEGDVTEVFIRGGAVAIDRRKLKSVVKALARCYAIDLKAQQANLRPRLRRQALLPFCLPPRRVFIPLKMRRALTGNDATYGYIDVSCVESISLSGEKSCRVRLCSGAELNILSRPATVIQAQYLGNLLRQQAAEDEYLDE